MAGAGRNDDENTEMPKEDKENKEQKSRAAEKVWQEKMLAWATRNKVPDVLRTRLEGMKVKAEKKLTERLELKKRKGEILAKYKSRHRILEQEREPEPMPEKRQGDEAYPYELAEIQTPSETSTSSTQSEHSDMYSMQALIDSVFADTGSGGSDRVVFGALHTVQWDPWMDIKVLQARTEKYFSNSTVRLNTIANLAATMPNEDDAKPKPDKKPKLKVNVEDIKEPPKAPTVKVGQKLPINRQAAGVKRPGIAPPPAVKKPATETPGIKKPPTEPAGTKKPAINK